MKLNLLAFLCINLPTTSWGAGGYANPSTQTQTQIQPSATPSSLIGNNNIGQSANSDNSMKTLSMAVSAGISMYCGYKAATTCSTQNYWECAAWVAGTITGAAAAISLSQSKNSSKKTAHSVTVGGNDANTSDPTNKDTTPLPAGVTEALNLLKKNGVKVDLDKGSFTTPDGKSYSTNDFSSPAAMNRAGLDGSKWSDFQKKLDEAKKDAEKKAQKMALVGTDGTDIGEGGGPKGISSGSNPGDRLATSGGLGLRNSQMARTAANIGGASVLYNGTPIGTAGNEVFEMIRVQYENQNKKNVLMNP